VLTHDSTSVVAVAEDALTTAAGDPQHASDLAHRVLGTQHPEASSIAYRALGLAAKELGSLAVAVRHLRRAVSVAESAGLSLRAAEARMSLMVLLADQGRTRDALAVAEMAAPVLSGRDRGRLLAQLGLVLQRVGRAEEALDCYRRALPVLRRADDVVWELRLRINRSVLHTYLGALAAAEADLERCLALAEDEGLELYRAFALGNRGLAALRRGDLPAALALLDDADRLKSALGTRRTSSLLDKADALLRAGLSGEARESAGEAVAESARGGYAYDLAESHLMLARASLADGDPATARIAASAARAAFIRQHRAAWAVLARDIEVRARWDEGERSNELLRAARRSAERLARANWPEESLHSRLIAAQIAGALGRRRIAERELLLASTARRRGPAGLRTTAWHGEALLRLARGDRVGAKRALRAGLRVLDEFSATLGATDLRSHAAVHGEALATLGLRMALQDRRPQEVLDWSERWRAGALRQRPVRPPGDRKLAADLAELRRVISAIAEAGVEGRNTAALRAEQVRLEASVRDRCRHAPGLCAPTGVLDVAELRAELAGRVLVELVRLDAGLYAVTVSAGEIRLFGLGEYADAIRELESLRFSMNRLARRHGSPALLAAATAAFGHSVTRLDELILAPLASAVGDAELVVVPTGALHALPWPVLPSCRHRAVSVAPSAHTWLATVRAAGSRRDRTVLVAGPDLEHAEPEVEALAARYPTATALVGKDSAAQDVLGTIDGAELAHIAAHGRFRSDNPLFSALQLADGPLTVYDLERLRRAPRRLVLSACESALSAVRPGDELMGLASAVFALGTSTLIASVTPVPDGGSRALMLDLHDRLSAGTPPARALAEANLATGIDGFVCFGAG
jgi:tetratricopeptide (TPR) repeat protein